MEQTKRGFGAWGWFLLIFGALIFFSNGGFFSDGTNIISPAVAENLQVEQSLILTMNSIAGVVGVLVAVVAGQLNQRIGPSKVTAGCLILAGLGHIAACHAVSVPMCPIAMCFVGGWITGQLLRTKEVWLCVFATGFLMLVQMGIMTQLVDRNKEVGMDPILAVNVMTPIAVIGIVGSVIFGRIVFRLGIKKAGVLTGLLYIAAMLLNVSGIMPLVIIGFLGAAAPNLMNSIPGSVFGRVGYAKANSVVFPLASIIYMLNFAVNGLIKALFNSLSVAYLVFAVLALISILLILALQDHKYDQDYMAAHGR